MLINAQQAHAALSGLFKELKPHLMAGRQFVIEAKEPTRSEDQSAKFHAMCEDFARSPATWGGQKRTKNEWKVLLVSGHTIATGGSVELVRGLEGELVNIRESTARMGVARSSSLIEYTLAMGTQMGVTFRETEQHDQHHQTR